MHDRSGNLEPSQGPIKRFSFCEVFSKAKPGYAPHRELEASFDIVQFQNKDYLNEIINEAELLTMAFKIGQTFNLSQKFTILVSSSELLDAILDECQVPLENRHQVIQIVYQMKNEHKFIQEITIYLKESKLIAGSQLEKFKELIKVNGTLASVKE